jgi:hypothetical protein
MGLLRIPFGFEVQQLDSVRLFMERTNTARALFPGEFDLGARISGGWRFLRYQAAVMNGHPSGDQQFALRDPTQSKDVLGRLGVDGHPGARVALAGGLSALYGTGFHAGTAATKNTIVWNDTDNNGQVEPTEIVGISGQPATPSYTFSRSALGADLELTVQLPRVGALAVGGELVWATNLDRGLVPADPIGVGRDLRELGWYVAVTQQLGRYAAVGVRYDHYDPDADAREQVGAALVPRERSFSSAALVAAAFVPPFGRVSIEYDHNTNALGRDASGAPATLGSDILTIRAQVVY